MQHDKPEFARRTEPSDLPELMDEACSYGDFRACLRDLGQVNRLTLAYRPTLRFLDRVLEERPELPLRIIDVGSGGGDMLRRIAVWAEQRGVAVSLVGIDLNPYAKRAAMETEVKGSSIQWITGDAFSYDQPIDVVISSLFTHHLAEAEIVQFLEWSEAVAQRGWFVNDLVREEIPYRLFGVMATMMRWHEFVRHDGPVSFLRSFREADWERTLAKAGIAREAVAMERWTPARLCVGRTK